MATVGKAPWISVGKLERDWEDGGGGQRFHKSAKSPPVFWPLSRGSRARDFYRFLSYAAFIARSSFPASPLFSFS